MEERAVLDAGEAEREGVDVLRQGDEHRRRELGELRPGEAAGVGEDVEGEGLEELLEVLADGEDKELRVGLGPGEGPVEEDEGVREEADERLAALGRAGGVDADGEGEPDGRLGIVEE